MRGIAKLGDFRRYNIKVAPFAPLKPANDQLNSPLTLSRTQSGGKLVHLMALT